ncbi:VOC family protein [Rathayibacter soli]|uniref:VOC family protein n=1 Tax=Rathayibacter soli TaxID=3144168 RepID=UPI0027E54270|nr:VOC family protein [Glaciibacter superstes]
MTVPEISGIHHVTLTVSDAPASAAWYRDVLGFEIVKQVQVSEITRVMMARSGFELVLDSHGDKAIPGPFSERRAGLDHLSFAVADRETLDQWAEHLDAVGVGRSPVKQGSSGSLVAFRDPDNIALEFYTLA